MVPEFLTAFVYALIDLVPVRLISSITAIPEERELSVPLLPDTFIIPVLLNTMFVEFALEDNFNP